MFASLLQRKRPISKFWTPQNHFLQTGCGCKVTFICVAPGSKRAEGRLHLGKKKCFSEIFDDSEAEWGITCLDNSESKDVLTWTTTTFWSFETVIIIMLCHNPQVHGAIAIMSPRNSLASRMSTVFASIPPSPLAFRFCSHHHHRHHQYHRQSCDCSPDMNSILFCVANGSLKVFLATKH